MNSYRSANLNSACMLLCLACMLVLASRMVEAQSCVSLPNPGMCYNQWTVQTGDSYIPRTAQCGCNGVSESFTSCWVRNTQCPSTPQCPTCAAMAGGSIDPATGDTNIAETDVSNPGLAGGLTLSRSWNSVSFEGTAQLGMFGLRWTSNFEESVFGGGDGFMKYLRADGGIWSFGFTGGRLYSVVGPANKTATLTQGPVNWTLAFENGEQRVFDLTTGRLLSITDRNGNTTTLNYDASYRVATVTDPASRHLYFTYASPGSFLANGVSSDFGVSLSYTYDQMGRLTKVIKPDSTTVSFQYDSNGYISAVLDNNNKVLESHTYDSTGRGLTSSRAGGAESITVSYPQPQSYGGVFLEP
jgi:YD repeat-containing protein